MQQRERLSVWAVAFKYAKSVRLISFEEKKKKTLDEEMKVKADFEFCFALLKHTLPSREDHRNALECFVMSDNYQQQSEVLN